VFFCTRRLDPDPALDGQQAAAGILGQRAGRQSNQQTADGDCSIDHQGIPYASFSRCTPDGNALQLRHCTQIL
jgi:hypothetical protein